MTRLGMCRNGFTLVEAIIAIVVVAAILAILIPIVRQRREQERQRLQTLADTQPWEVFEFLAAPAQVTFGQDEEIVAHCEMINLTDYPLTFPSGIYHVMFADTNYYVGAASQLNSISQTPIPPGKSAKFDLALRPRATGAAKVKIVFIKPDKPIVTKRDSIREYVKASYPNDENRFGSQAFLLVVAKSEPSPWPTFDEKAAEAKRTWGDIGSQLEFPTPSVKLLRLSPPTEAGKNRGQNRVSL